MKREIYLALLFSSFIISMSFVSAISTTIKDSYSPGETIISKISGSILEPITNADAELKRINVLVPFDYEIKKLGEDYYFWMTSPIQERNYTLRIKDITTYVSGKVEKVDYEKNFSVSGNISDYSVKPGAISTNGDFEINVQLNEDFDKSIDINFIEAKTFLLKPGENTIKFSIDSLNESALFNISLGKYEVPVYVTINKSDYSIENESAPNFTDDSDIIDLTNISGGISTTLTQQEASNYHCYEFPGKVCSANQVCSGENRASLDGECCIRGECIIPSRGISTSTWIGYLLGALVIIILVVIWIRYRKIKKEMNPLAKKVKEFDKRIP